jgi:hypothetical protein
MEKVFAGSTENLWIGGFAGGAKSMLSGKKTWNFWRLLIKSLNIDFNKDSSYFVESINPSLAERQHFLAAFCMTPSLWPIDMSLDLGEFKGAVDIAVDLGQVVLEIETV